MVRQWCEVVLLYALVHMVRITPGNTQHYENTLKLSGEAAEAGLKASQILFFDRCRMCDNPYHSVAGGKSSVYPFLRLLQFRYPI
jgi:hypothetical protein